MEDYRTAPIEPEMKTLLGFAEDVARDASQIRSDDITSLRAAGFSDRAILDAAHVAGFFSYMNRVVQALGADGTNGRPQQVNHCTDHALTNVSIVQPDHRVFQIEA